MATLAPGFAGRSTRATGMSSPAAGGRPSDGGAILLIFLKNSPIISYQIPPHRCCRAAHQHKETRHGTEQETRHVRSRLRPAAGARQASQGAGSISHGCAAIPCYAPHLPCSSPNIRCSSSEQGIRAIALILRRDQAALAGGNGGNRPESSKFAVKLPVLRESAGGMIEMRCSSSSAPAKRATPSPETRRLDQAARLMSTW